MRTVTKRTMLCMLLVAAASPPTISDAAEGPTAQVDATVGVTPSLIVETGTTVTLSASHLLIPNLKAEPKYRWLKDEVEMTNHTGSAYKIYNATLSDAAEYSVIIYA